MHHHLAKYACTLCLVKTEVKDDIRFFPRYDNKNRPFQMRTSKIHKECLQILREEKCKPVKGVKGPSQLFSLISDLPLTAPIDVMHQVQIGVTKVMLSVIEAKTIKSDKERLNQIFSSLQVSLQDLPSHIFWKLVIFVF